LRYGQRLLPVNLRISKIVNATPKASAPAVSVNIRYSGQFNPNEMLSIIAAIDALNVAAEHAKADVLTGFPAV